MPVRTPSKPLRARADITLARKHAGKAIERLVELMAANDARISLAAATAILDRAYMRAAAMTGEDAPQGQTFTAIERVIVHKGH